MLYLEESCAPRLEVSWPFGKPCTISLMEVVKRLLYRVLHLFVTGVGAVEWRKCL
jgi:hypothetical protein